MLAKGGSLISRAVYRLSSGAGVLSGIGTCADSDISEFRPSLGEWATKSRFTEEFMTYCRLEVLFVKVQ